MDAQINLQEKGYPKKIWTRDFLLISFANFFVYLAFQMTLPTIPLFVKELGGSDQLIGLIVGAFTFSALIFRPYAGHALESKGRGFVHMAGLAVFILSVGSFAFVTSIAFLITTRVVQGAGYGFATTASGTIATDLIPPKRRGEGMGYFGLSGNLALALGPALGLTLVGFMSFTSFFLICAALGLVALLLSSKIRYKKVEQSSHKTTTVKFDIFEKTAIQPAMLFFFVTFTFGGHTSFLPLYAAEKSIAGIEVYFLIYAVFLMVSRTFAGKIYDVKGHAFVFPLGVSLIFIAMLLLAWLPNLIIMLIAASLYGLGYGCVQPALQAWAIDQAPNNRKGMANATFLSFSDLGVGIGAITFGWIAQHFNYRSIYIVAASVVMLSLLFHIYLLIRAKRQLHT